MVDKKFGSIKIDWQKLKVQFSPNINLTSKRNQPTPNGKVSNETIIRFEILSDKIDTLECKTYCFESDEIVNEEPINKSNPWYFDFCGEETLNKNKEETIPTSPQETEATKSSINPSFYDSLKKPIQKSPVDIKSQPISQKQTPEPPVLFEKLKKATPEHPKTPIVQPPPREKVPEIQPPSRVKAPDILPPSKTKAPEIQPPTKEKTIQQASVNKLDTKTIPQPPSVSDFQIPLLEPAETKFQTVDEQIKNLEDQLTSTRNIILNLDKRLSAGLFNFDEYLEKKNFLIKKIENIKQQIEKFKKKA
jgi:hypothetical protein